MRHQELLYDKLVEPLMKKADPERAHEWAMWMLETASRSKMGLRLVEQVFEKEVDPRLRCEIAGIRFDNPLFLAGGFDKDGRAVPALERIGFGSVEVGTVVRFAQHGNDRPRIKRLGGGSLFNKMGFPSQGAEKVRQRLSELRAEKPLGVSIGVNKSRMESYREDLYWLSSTFAPVCDYLVVNISSPNTVGLRGFLSRNYVGSVIEAVEAGIEESGQESRLFLKISPDMQINELDEAVDCCLTKKVDGIIATNTTNDLDLKASYGLNEPLVGGISGRALKDKANQVIAHIYSQVGEDLPVIGSGGVSDLASAIEKVRLGAQALSVYTAFVDNGPFWPSNLLGEMSKWMEERGVLSLAEVRGQN